MVRTQLVFSQVTEVREGQTEKVSEGQTEIIGQPKSPIIGMMMRRGRRNCPQSAGDRTTGSESGATGLATRAAAAGPQTYQFSVNCWRDSITNSDLERLTNSHLA